MDFGLLATTSGTPKQFKLAGLRTLSLLELRELGMNGMNLSVAKRHILVPIICLVLGAVIGFSVRPTFSRLAHPKPEPEAHDPSVPAPSRFPQRHLAMLETVSTTSDVQSVWLGDSITDGWRDVPHLWVEYFGNSLNLGISWDCVENVHWRAVNGELDGVRPRVVVILIGTNNLSQGDSAEATAAGVRLLIATVRTRQPAAHILLLGVLPRTPDSLMPAVRDLNARLATLADGDSTIFLDIGNQFLSRDNSVDLSLLPDGLHPSPAGYKAIGQAVGSVVKVIAAR
jgi:lysophospholipase L1-like esterase